MLLLGIVGVAVFFWAVRNGQYDDMEGAAHRVLMDDDESESVSETADKDGLDDKNSSNVQQK